jgi:dipeptidyl aminopeptidase/acylaminoacyl peptidase
MGENAVYTSYLASYDSDGLTVYGLLTQPKGEPPPGGWPAIVFVHGYIPPAQYQTQVNYVSYVDFLARSGLVVFKIDLRGHGNSQGDPGGAYYSSDYVIDTLNARAALSSSDFVNPEKIGLWGHSMAGNVVLRSFAARPKIPAVVVWAGAGYTYTDLLEYRLRDASYRPPVTDTQRQRRRQELREAYGEFDPQDAFWRRVAVTDYLPDLKGALQLHHAVDDAVVSIEYSRNLVNRLDKTDVVHELFEYPGGGHNLTGSSFTQAMERTAAFFDAHLGE